MFYNLCLFFHKIDDWKEELQKYISPDQLPQAYGGTRCEPDPYCSKYVKIYISFLLFSRSFALYQPQINQGGDIPEKFYMTNLTETSREEMERVVIGRGSAHNVTLMVDKCGSIIRWEFVSAEYDVAFGVYQQPEKEGEKKLENEAVVSGYVRN